MQGRTRATVKTDAQSTIGRGAVLYREHFEPPMARLTAAIIRAAERLLPSSQVMLTEGWRPQREPGRRDLHTELAAIDYTIWLPTLKRRATTAEYRAVAEAARAEVGDAEYDFLVHGVGLNEHIHAERDPK